MVKADGIKVVYYTEGEIDYMDRLNVVRATNSNNTSIQRHQEVFNAQL